MEFFLKKTKKNAKKIKKHFFFFYNPPLPPYFEICKKKKFQKIFRTSFIRVFPNLSQFSNFVSDNGDKNGDSDGDVTDENFALKLEEGVVNMYTKGMGNLKRVVMAKICSQTHPLAGGTQNLGQPKKHFFDTFFKFWL